MRKPTKYQRQEAALDAARDAQSIYWKAIRLLEIELRMEIDDVPDLMSFTVGEIIEYVKQGRKRRAHAH